MKLLTYVAADGRDCVGALDSTGQGIIDLGHLFPDMLALIDGGVEAVTAARSAVDAGRAARPLAGARLRAPVPVPRQIRDGMAFEQHVRQAGRTVAKMRAGVFAPLLLALGIPKVPAVWYRQPIYYKSNRFSVIGHETDVIWPSYSRLMDYELEFGVFIGKGGKNIPRERAREHIFGYTIFNDMSARDAQGWEMAARLGPAKGKDFDTGNVIGPWIVTADELTDPYNLAMVARVNGVEWSRGHSGTMRHRFEDFIAHISRDETIHPGEFIGSGTVGNGCGLELGRFLKPNDMIELEVEGIGILRNRLVKLGAG